MPPGIFVQHGSHSMAQTAAVVDPAGDARASEFAFTPCPMCSWQTSGLMKNKSGAVTTMATTTVEAIPKTQERQLAFNML